MTKTIYSVDRARQLAKKRLPKMVYEFLEGGALDEITLKRNSEAFGEYRFEQRVLQDMTGIDTGKQVLGTKLSLPLVVSPMGLLSILHPDGDLAIARATAEAGSIMIQSPWSALSLEEVSEAANGRVWAQIAFWKNRNETMEHVARAKRAGIDTLIVAGDVAFSSKRERDIKHGVGMPPKPPLADVINVALHPSWLAGFLLRTRMTWGNYRIDGRRIKMREMDPWMTEQESITATWQEIKELRNNWDGNLIIKGVMSPKDVEEAVAAGVDGVFVSNHGGRQFDSQAGTLDVLPQIAEAAADKVTVMVDGGVRRGSDILAALQSGADLVSAGRPFAYGLSASGHRGVQQVFEVLKDELETAMGFTGVRGF